MNTCGTEIICGFLAQYITISSPLQYALIQIVVIVTAVAGAFQFGKIAGRSNGESMFISGIMYHINVLAYNDAKIPQKHEPENDKYLAEAQKRLEKKLKPKIP